MLEIICGLILFVLILIAAQLKTIITYQKLAMTTAKLPNRLDSMADGLRDIYSELGEIKTKIVHSRNINQSSNDINMKKLLMEFEYINFLLSNRNRTTLRKD